MALQAKKPVQATTKIFLIKPLTELIIFQMAIGRYSGGDLEILRRCM